MAKNPPPRAHPLDAHTNPETGEVYVLAISSDDTATGRPGKVHLALVPARDVDASGSVPSHVRVCNSGLGTVINVPYQYLTDDSLCLACRRHIHRHIH